MAIRQAAPHDGGPDSDARKRIVESTTVADPQVEARERAERIANELAVLVAHEHRRAKEEQQRREEAEATASQLAVLLAHEHADLEYEREARARAQAEARELSAAALGELRPMRFDRARPSARPPVRPAPRRPRAFGRAV
jgi:hypothetical protein